MIFIPSQKATPHWSTARRIYLNFQFLLNTMTPKLHLIRNGKLAGLVTTRFYHTPRKHSSPRSGSWLTLTKPITQKIDFVERYALLNSYHGVNLWSELQLPQIG